jgi:hypothetical protein
MMGNAAETATVMQTGGGRKAATVRRY